MYLRHYGLRDKPFKLAHDPAYYYSAAHQIPLNELCYAIEERQGLTTLIGDPGTGKTTLLRRLLTSFAPTQRGVFMSDASLGGHSIIRQVEYAVGVVAGSGQRHGSLRDVLTRAANTTVVLLIDEAQGLTSQQLEEIRHLSNLDAPGRKLLEIIMAGQPALEEKLAAKDMAALRQRVAVRCELEPLDILHTKAYIEHRLRVARARDISMFTGDAIELLQERSRGIPRLINIICERCLVVGYASDKQVIDGSTAAEALADLHIDLEKEESEPPPVSALTGDGLLVRMGSRIEAIEEKLDILMQVLTRMGIARPELAETARTRRYLEKLQETQEPTDDSPTNEPEPSQQATTRLKVKKLPRTKSS